MTLLDDPAAHAAATPSVGGRRPFVPETPVAAPTASPSGTRPTAGRRKLWQLDDHHHCLVLGTCLEPDEVRAVATRAGFEHDELEDYDVHHACVHAARDRRHPLARGLQKRLEAKFARDVRLFGRALDERARRALWRTRLDDGDIGGALWALVTRAARDTELLAEVYGQVHMLQHGTCAREARLRQRAAKAAQGRDALAAELDRSRASARSRLGEAADRIVALERALDVARTERDEIRSTTSGEAASAEGADAAGDDLRKRLDATRATLSRKSSLVETLRARACHHRAQRASDAAERARLRDDIARLECLVDRLLGPDSDRDRGDDAGHGSGEAHGERPSPALCGRCVLVIGGQARQCRHFRALVEANEGTFLHHDGGVEDRATRVAALVRRADVVLCPTEQVSHDAMHRAKRICRADDKPMIYLQRSSLAAFADGLERLSATPASRPAHG